MPEELCYKTISDIAPLIENREVSPVEITACMLDRIDALDSQIQSFTCVTRELATTQAKLAEEEVMSGFYRGPLHGVPVAVKDLFYTAGIPTTCASTLLQNWLPAYNATAVEKLANAGSVMLGKLSLTEFATAGYHPDLKHPYNPWNTHHGAGVSSSGSGAATAAGFCFGSLGTDTGGSIRMPAAACGISGLKPTFGRISRYGVYPLSNTLDHVGPMARSADDLRILFKAISGHDPQDEASNRTAPKFSEVTLTDLKGVRIGIDYNYITKDVEPQVSKAVMSGAKILEDLGAELCEIDLSFVIDICHYWKPLLSSEAALVHQLQTSKDKSVYGQVFADILDYSDQVNGQTIAKAFIERQHVQHKLAQVFNAIDIILCPTEPFSAPSWEAFPPQFITPIDALAWVLRFSAPYNFSGNPCLALPAGFTAGGLPLSLQLIGPWNHDEALLNVGSLYQIATDWHKQHPSLQAGSAP